MKAVADLAAKHGWSGMIHQPENLMLSFFKGEKENRTRVNVYYTTMTVGTALKHPTKGKTQLFRRNVSPAMLERILKNPRTHTQRGYYERRRPIIR